MRDQRTRLLHPNQEPFVPNVHLERYLGLLAVSTEMAFADQHAEYHSLFEIREIAGVAWFSLFHREVCRETRELCVRQAERPFCGDARSSRKARAASTRSFRNDHDTAVRPGLGALRSTCAPSIERRVLEARRSFVGARRAARLRAPPIEMNGSTARRPSAHLRPHARFRWQSARGAPAQCAAVSARSATTSPRRSEHAEARSSKTAPS